MSRRQGAKRACTSCGQRPRLARSALAAAVILISLCWRPAEAQTIPPSTPLSTAEQAIPSREEVTPPTPPVQSTAPSVTIDSRSALPRPDCPFQTSPIRLNLRQIVLQRPDGSPLQPDIARTLAALALPTGDQPISVVCAVRDQANLLLADAGWIASVQVPQQRIADGVLRLNVVTARITEVRVRGEPGPYRRLLERRVAELRAFDPLNRQRVERLLLLTGDAPGVEIQLSLRPAGTAPGDVIGELAVTFRRFAVTTAVQNLNARSLGRETVYSRLELYGLTGRADVTYLGASTTTDFYEQRVVQAGHILGLGGGSTVGGRFTYAWSRPDLGALDLRTDTLIWGLDLAMPLVRSVGGNLRAALGFDYVDQRTDVGSGANAALLNLDKIRTPFARLSGDLLQRGGGGQIGYSFSAGVELRKGLGILDATRPLGSGTGALPSRIQGDARAVIVRGDMDAVIGVGQFISALASARAQWADRPLLAYDEFSVGNLTIGRGYDPGSNSGDRAIGLRSEVQINPTILPRFKPQLFTFVDAVLLTNLDAGASEVDRRLRSVGGGLRLLFANRLAAEIAYARPIDRALLINRSRPPDRLLFSLIVQARGRVQR